MTGIILARKLLAANWQDQIEKKLGLETRVFSLATDLDLMECINEKCDFFIIESTVPIRNSVDKLALQNGPSVVGAQYILSKLRGDGNPNNKTPVIYTSVLTWEKIGELRDFFESHNDVYFFHELETDGMAPAVEDIMKKYDF